ncbi:hypothetical protein M2164_000377 [Streptomyces sp. SAI-208]|uniref:transposase n=1 Tax=Streptomyces sp. SAI-208 TaxID=2940550 RepID=UPI0024735B33|nr:transposase [Streptomyces sp. SAI-208]MDH6604742.1 hypothetical protein [Streptomyces sp. SAI-208]
MIDDLADATWGRELDDLRLGRRFGPADLRWRTRDYVRAPPGAVGRKTAGNLRTRRPPHPRRSATATERSHLVHRRRPRRHADRCRHKLGEPDGVLILDATGCIKKGTASAGVQRPHSGTAGRTEIPRRGSPSQIGAFAAYATTRACALVDRELYVPKSWTGDCARCRAATIPVERGFATKPELARAMVLRAPASPLSIAWVTVDAAGRWPGARTSVGELQPVARRYSHGPGTPRPSCR